MPVSASPSLDGRRVRGDSSRRAVMAVAVDLASVDGLDGLSIGALAARSGMSKGGVVALFGSKEQLQLATIEAAIEVFHEHVLAPALAETGGLARLRVLTDAWLRYSQSRVFAGGCFFAAASAELGSRPGAAHDAIAKAMTDWQAFMRRTVERAIDRGELSPGTDAGQLSFEITSLLDGANDLSLLFGSDEPYRRARTAISRLLA
jgi:AcrR family transcriptional regulator